MSEVPITCRVCPHHCKLTPGRTGLCRARKNTGDKIEGINYAFISSAALDPIEKKPLKHFHPGSLILSAGSFGCNLSCPFCQNYEISQASAHDTPGDLLSPEELVSWALDLKRLRGNIGAAFTYNEPLTGYEYVRDCSKLLKEQGLYSVVVTNGCFTDEVLSEVLPFIDAFNIDLKGFSQKAYDIMGGDLETVKSFIKKAASSSHVEITSLIVPGINDDPDEMTAQAKWISSIRPDIPLHITRYFPRWKFHEAPTDIQRLYELTERAGKYLKHVYIGNI